MATDLGHRELVQCVYRDHFYLRELPKGAIRLDVLLTNVIRLT
jgi:hypothetical protein